MEKRTILCPPLKEILLSDYENHMKWNTIMQPQMLNNMMKKQFYQYPINTLMIFGIAGGNGLQHIDPNHIRKVIGVDINASFYRHIRSIIKT